MRRLVFASLLISLASASFADDLVDLGHEIAQTNCARCHAIGKTGTSTHPEAPPFRTLSSRYPIEALDEAFAEGIRVGHKDMPVFTPTPEQAGALLAYLELIQAD